jgi:hypothetical protein
MIVSPIQDFPYNFLLNSAAEPDRQQNISFAPDIQAFRQSLDIGFVFSNSFSSSSRCPLNAEH